MSQIDTHIRAARPEDIFALTGVYTETQRATYQGILPHDALEYAIARRKPEWWRRNLGSGSSTLILEYDGRSEGYVTYGPSRYGELAYEGEIYEIYIRPAFQGCGFGRKLFDRAQGELKRAGHTGLMLWTIEANRKAGEFFIHLGGESFARAELHYRTKTLTRVAIGWLDDSLEG